MPDKSTILLDAGNEAATGTPFDDNSMTESSVISPLSVTRSTLSASSNSKEIKMTPSRSLHNNHRKWRALG
jgi:hypothetical protein